MAQDSAPETQAVIFAKDVDLMEVSLSWWVVVLWKVALSEADDFATELVATCDFQEFADYRAQITCFKDRRPDVYGTLP